MIPPVAEQIISFFAGSLIVFAQLTLIRDVFRKKISPSLLSWFGWALLMGTGLLSQIIEKGWEWNLIGLSISTLGCLFIFLSAWILNNYLIKKSDWSFLVLGLVCLFIYITSKDPWLTTGFAILADFIVGIPTLVHAYKNPVTQRTFAWTIGFFSWILTIFICIGHEWIYALFPIYLLLYNGAMMLLTRRSRILSREYRST